MPSRLEESRGGVAGAHWGGGSRETGPASASARHRRLIQPHFTIEPVHHLSFHKAEGSALNHHGSTRRKTRGAGAQHRRHCAAPWTCSEARAHPDPHTRQVSLIPHTGHFPLTICEPSWGKGQGEEERSKRTKHQRRRRRPSPHPCTAIPRYLQSSMRGKCQNRSTRIIHSQLISPSAQMASTTVGDGKGPTPTSTSTPTPTPTLPSTASPAESMFR